MTGFWIGLGLVWLTIIGAYVVTKGRAWMRDADAFIHREISDELTSWQPHVNPHKDRSLAGKARRRARVLSRRTERT